MNEEYMKIVAGGGRAIPGQSLTMNPDDPQPYERPPQYTSVHEASEEIFSRLIEEETYKQLIMVLGDGMPVMDVVQTMLFTGFSEGKWNPDLMLMLVEPVAYMILALAERAGLDPVIYREEDEDEAEDREVLGATLEKDRLDRVQKLASLGKAPASGVTPQMVETIQELPVPQVDSLMARPETPEAPDSLLAPQPEEEV